MSTKRKILWVLVILTLVFIFGQSFLNQTISNKESKIVKETIVQPVHQTITGKTTTAPKIRDVAHIIEFTALGLELVLLFKNKKILMRLLRSISYCGMIALVDESIQFLSDRAPQVIDIWNDILGGAIGAVIGILIITIIEKHVEKRRVV